MSYKVRFLLSDTPFPCGVPRGVSCETISHSFKYTSRLKYPPLQSDRKILIFLSKLVFYFSLEFLELFIGFRLISHLVDIIISTEIISKGDEVTTTISRTSTHLSTYISMYKT